MEIEIKEYGRTELAVLMYPDKAIPELAWKHLKLRIKQTPELCQRLDKLHYNPKKQRYFTKEQTRVILQYL